jgi:hypothetical protein
MRLRFSIATLLGVVGLAAVGFAALRSATEPWASATFTATVAVLSTAALGALLCRGRSRSAWIGLAVFGWIYLAVTFGPWPRNVVGPPPLLTVTLLDLVQDYVFSDGKTPYLTTIPNTQVDQVFDLRGQAQPAIVVPPGPPIQPAIEVSPGPPILPSPDPQLGTPPGPQIGMPPVLADPGPQMGTPPGLLPTAGLMTLDLTVYQQIGHSLAALLFGLAGAVAGRIFGGRDGGS